MSVIKQDIQKLISTLRIEKRDKDAFLQKLDSLPEGELEAFLGSLEIIRDMANLRNVEEQFINFNEQRDTLLSNDKRKILEDLKTIKEDFEHTSEDSILSKISEL